MPLKATIEFIKSKLDFDKEVSSFVDRAVQKSVKVMERNIKINTPVKHGYLRRSISSQKTSFGKAEVFTNPIGNVAEKTSKKKGISRTKPVSYAVFLEYGTRYIAPRAMFRKGVGQSEKQIKQIFAEEAKATLNKAKGVK